MDSYIRNFNVNKIHTNTVDNSKEYNSLVEIKNDTYLKIIHNNIRSICKNFDEFLVFLNQFNLEFDIIILSETFEIKNTDLYRLAGYSEIYNEGKVNKNDGVLIYVKQSLHHSFEIVELKNIKYDSGKTKINIINLTININNKIMLITAAYRSPNTSADDFNRELNSFLQLYRNVETHVIIGDININISSADDHVQDYLNILGEYGFSSYINSFTRIQNEQKSIIDHIFIKNNENNINFMPIIFQNLITDHYPVILNVNLNCKLNNVNYNKPCYKKYTDYKQLKIDLQHEGWDNIYNNNNVDQITDNFITKLEHYINKNTRTTKLKRHETPRKEWITTGLLNSIKTKNNLYKMMADNPLNINLANQYKIYKNKLSQLIKNTKTRYYRNLINKNNDYTQNLWSTVNKLCNRNKSQTSIEQIEINNEIITDKKEIADKFNHHYSEVGASLARQITQTSNFTLDNRETSLENTIFLSPTNENEVKKIILELKSHKAPGHDNIKAETLKEVVDEITAPIKYIINKAIDLGFFPNILKIGIIKPLYKKGSKLEMSNYRPVSLISNISKVFEKILKIRIVNFLNKYNIISDKQFGFRENTSTQDAIAYLTSMIYDSLDKSKPSLCIFVDLAKAFDTVCHKKLLEKLKNYGFRGKAFELMKSYLSERTQYVSIDGIKSERREISYGVPQGTVLGPILFILYINNLFTLNTTGQILSFADDTVIFYSEDNWENLKTMAEKDFNRIKQWFDKNTLTMNIDKTKYLTFTSYKNNLPNLGPLKINARTSITEAESIKYLGIIIDRHLKWDLQINNIINKIRYLLSNFKHLKSYLDIKELKTLYFALVQSQLSYGIIAWGGVVDSYLKKLEVIQKWILKIIFKKEYTYPSEALFEEAEVFTIRKLYCVALLVYLKKNEQNIKFNQHIYHTRHKLKITKKPVTKKTIGQKSHTYLGPKLFDHVPDSLKNINNIKIFKNKIKKWLLSIKNTVIEYIIKNDSYSSFRVQNY